MEEGGRMEGSIHLTHIQYMGDKQISVDFNHSVLLTEMLTNLLIN